MAQRCCPWYDHHPGNSRLTHRSFASAPLGILRPRSGWPNILLHCYRHCDLHGAAVGRRSSARGTRHAQAQPDYADFAFNFRALCAIDSRSDVPSSWNELVASRSECAGGSVCSSLDCYSRAFVVLENRSDSPSGSAHAGLADCAAMSWISCISHSRGLGTRCDSARTAHGELDGCARRRGRGPAGPAVISVQDLVHRYDDRLALNGVSFDVRPAELFGLLGPNGSGKTTLFRILSTLMIPTGGRALILGHDAARDPNSLRRQIG